MYAKLSWAERAKSWMCYCKRTIESFLLDTTEYSGWSNICEEDNVTKDEVLHAETNAIAKVTL